MRRILVVAVVAITVSSLALGQTTGKKAIRTTNGRLDNELISLERKTWDLWKKSDKLGYAELLTDDFLSIDAHGVATKTENLKQIDELIKEEYSLSDFKVEKIEKNVALIIYKAKLKGIYKGQRFENAYYASSVWVNRKGNWRNIFYQETVSK